MHRCTGGSDAMLHQEIPAMIPMRVMDAGIWLSGRSGDERDSGNHLVFVHEKVNPVGTVPE